MDNWYMITPQTASSGPKPASARLRRSCERCRVSKGKCLLSEDSPSQCQRCLKDGKTCIFLQARARPKKLKTSRTRVAEMEQKIDGLYALLSSTKAAKDHASPTAPNQIDELLLPLDHASLPRFSSSPRTEKEISCFPDFSFPYSVDDNIQDVISKGVVSFDQAEQSLEIFRAKASSFPFVLVPPRMKLDSMRRQKPFFLLSILTLTAPMTSKCQSQLELELRETLSRRLIVNGEKSIDLLQGLLIYLNWYHIFFRMQRQQVYQLTQMAVAMAIDLGINKPLQNTLSPGNFTILGESTKIGSGSTALPMAKSPRHKYDNDYFPPSTLLQATTKSAVYSGAAPRVFISTKSPEEVEARRTLLGCFYLSSSICQGLRKPNSLKYDAYIRDCGSVLAGLGEADNDFLLPFFVQIQNIAEQINHAFSLNTAIELPKLDSNRVELLWKRFGQDLEEFELSLTENVWSNVHITLSYYSTRIYLNEIGFHGMLTSSFEIISTQPTNHAWYNSSVRSEILISSLQASKDYLDRFISLPSETFFRMTVTDFFHLIYAVLVLGRFVTGWDAPILDVSHARRAANMDYYLNRLIWLLDPIVMPSDGRPDGELVNYIWHIRRLFKQTKVWHNQILADPFDGTSAPVQKELSFMEILPSVIGLCGDFSASLEGMSSDDKWVDMLADWPSPGIDASMLESTPAFAGGSK